MERSPCLLEDEWANAYVGIPWRWKGRTRAGVDCYGLVRLVYREELGIELPEHQYLSPSDASGAIAAEAGGREWRRVATPRECDVAIVDSVCRTSDGYRRGAWHLVLNVSHTFVLHALEPVGTVIAPNPVNIEGGTVPSDSVRLEGCRLPLGQKRYTMRFEPGSTLEDVIREAAGNDPVAVQVDGEPVPPHLWPKLRVKGNALITVAPQAGAQVLLVALAAFAVGAAIVFLLPQPGSPEDVEQQRKLEGGTNRANPYGPFPKVFGRFRFAPPLGNEWIPYVGQRAASMVPSVPGVFGMGLWQPVPAAMDQKEWIRALLVWTLGKADISDIRLDATPAADYGDAVRLVTSIGANADFPNAVRRLKLGADLNGAATVTRRIGRVETEATVNLVWPQGLYRVNNKGEIHGFDDASESDKRPIGLTIQLTDEAGTVLDTEDVSAQGGSTVTPYYQAFTLQAGSAQNCVLKVTRDIAARESLKAHDDLRIDTVVIPLAAAPLSETCTVTSVRIQATDQISGTVPAISGVALSRIPDWDGAAWTEGPTRNPASAFREVLVGSGNALALADSRLASGRLQEWWEHCDTEGWTYDAAHLQQKGLEDVLKEIAAAGRAAPAWVDGLRGVVIDKSQVNRIQVFTPANSGRFSARRDAKPVPHALRCRYRDEDEDYAQAEVRVYRPGYTANNATMIEERRLPGQTVQNTVAAHLAYQLRNELARREQYAIEVDWEHLAAEIGARVGLQHDALHDRAWSGRALSVTAVDAESVDVALDIAADLQAGIQYWGIVRPADELPGTYVAEHTGTAGTARLRGSGAVPTVAAGDLVAIGQVGTGIEDCIITGIDDAGDAGARLTLSAYGGSAVFNAQTGYTVEHTTGGGMVNEVPFGARELNRLGPTPIIATQQIYFAGLNKPNAPSGETIPQGWSAVIPDAAIVWMVARQLTIYPLIASPPPATYTIAGVEVPVGSPIDFGPWGEVTIAPSELGPPRTLVLYTRSIEPPQKLPNLPVA